MNKKYELTDETIEIAYGTVLHRIRAVMDITFSNGDEVHAGDLGGWIEKESNLLQNGNSWVCGNARVFGNAMVCGYAKVCGNAMVCGYAEVFGDAEVCGNARVFGYAEVCGDAKVCGNAKIERSSDYIVFKNSWSSMRWFTYTRSNKMWSVGCFYGTGEELVAKAYKDSELSGRCYEAIVRAQEAIEKAIEDEEAK